jgi:hypothetical protein
MQSSTDSVQERGRPRRVGNGDAPHLVVGSRFAWKAVVSVVREQSLCRRQNRLLMNTITQPALGSILGTLDF